jgi:Holliday junction resolvasome RuvABC endonuclease subunit
MTRVLGIDPGSVSAAWAIIDPENGLALADDVPVVDRMVDAVGFARVIREHQPTVAIIEVVSAMPRQGARSGFRFGMGTGIVRGVLGALEVPLHEVSATRWKKSYGIGPDKERARGLAIRFYPGLQAQLAHKKNAGRAEALLIAHWFVEQRRG